ncbi:MAG: TolC family protein [Opitutaceae bacterium]|nr:TolC family protein [Opitutaceae bacterium]
MSSFHSRFQTHLVRCVVLLLVPVPGRMQDTTTPVLSLGDALARASSGNPSLAAYSYTQRAAEGLVEQAGLRPNPTLEFTAENFMGTGRVQGVRGLEATVQASQTFERGDKRGKRVALAGREKESAAKEYAVQRTEVLATTAVAYLEVIVARERLALADEPLRLARETVSAVDHRVKAGAASPAESARARAALASTQADHVRAEAALVAARTALAATWGGAGADMPAVTGALRLPEALPVREEMSARLASHPRIDHQRSIAAGRRAALDLEQAQAVQDVSVGGGVRFLREGSDAAFVAGVSVPLPVRNRNQGNIRAARENLSGAEQGVHAIEFELRADFNAAWQDLASAFKVAQDLRRAALPATEESYSIVRAAYEQGQLPIIDVLDAQRALGALRREILDAEADYAFALARIDALTDTNFSAVSSLISKP